MITIAIILGAAALGVVLGFAGVWWGFSHASDPILPL